MACPKRMLACDSDRAAWPRSANSMWITGVFRVGRLYRQPGSASRQRGITATTDMVSAGGSIIFHTADDQLTFLQPKETAVSSSSQSQSCLWSSSSQVATTVRLWLIRRSGSRLIMCCLRSERPRRANRVAAVQYLNGEFMPDMAIQDQIDAIIENAINET